MADRDFKGVWIPKNIWLSKDLTLQEKVFFVEIDSLDNENGCFASNSYFAEFFGLSTRRVSSIIKSLCDKGLIKSTIFYKKGTKQIEKRVLNVCSIPLSKESSIPYGRKVQEPMEGKFADNSTLNNKFNNTDNNINNKEETSSSNGESSSSSDESEKSNDVKDPKKKKEKSCVKKEKIDYEEIQRIFNQVCTSLPSIRKMTAKRKKAIDVFLKDNSLIDLGDLFKQVEASDFLSGRKTGWSSDFNWILNTENTIKIQEGTYDNKSNPKEKTFAEKEQERIDGLKGKFAEALNMMNNKL